MLPTQAFDFGPNSFKAREGRESWLGSMLIQTAKLDLERQVVRALESKQKVQSNDLCTYY